MRWLDKTAWAGVWVMLAAACVVDEADPDVDTDSGATATDGLSETGQGSTQGSSSSSGGTSGTTGSTTTTSSTGTSGTTTTTSTTEDGTTGFCENFLPEIGPETLPTIFVGEPVDVTFDIGGEPNPAGIQWTLSNAPETLTLDAETGELTGTVEDLGPYTINVHAEAIDPDPACPTVPTSRDYELDIVAAQ